MHFEQGLEGQLRGGKVSEKSERLTLLLSSNDLDKAFLAFMLATGARSMGLEVTVFFSLWSINLLRREKDQPGIPSDPTVEEKKGMMAKMMAMMMPKGPENAGLSKMNFGGMGAMMMKDFIKKSGAPSLPELMDMAVTAGVEFTICTLTMEIMGFQKEDLIELPNVAFGGIASCLGSAINSKMFLAI